MALQRAGSMIVRRTKKIPLSSRGVLSPVQSGFGVWDRSLDFFVCYFVTHGYLGDGAKHCGNAAILCLR